MGPGARWLWLALAWLAGCGESAAQRPPGARCTSELRPEFEACWRGYLFAECGGLGYDPVLACRGNECLWFSASCAADGFEVSDCPASEVCCHDGWPFVEGAGPQDRFRLASDLHALGTLPWDRERAVVVLTTIDPTLTASETRFTCTGVNPAVLGTQGACDGQLTMPYVEVGQTVTIGVNGLGVAGWFPWIEIVPGDGVLNARVCAYPYSDAPPAMCGGAQAVCATSGTVRLSREPASTAEATGLVAELDVTFDFGMQLTGTIVVP